MARLSVFALLKQLAKTDGWSNDQILSVRYLPRVVANLENARIFIILRTNVISGDLHVDTAICWLPGYLHRLY